MPQDNKALAADLGHATQRVSTLSSLGDKEKELARAIKQVPVALIVAERVS
jgi:hypothetical protein